MESKQYSEALLSQRDLPLWARGIASGLLLFASWWLLNTEGIRSAVGDSIGALCLGVIAASTLQGMRLPLALWPDGPWRKRFSVPAVIVTATLLAAMILSAKATGSEVLATQIDIGAAITVVVGTIGLGFAFGFVRQARYLAWYGIAVGLAILPVAFDLVFASPNRGAIDRVFPSLLVLTAVGVTSKLVTEELAFRRLLIGIAPGAGLLSIMASTATALVWFALLSRAGIGGYSIVLMGTLGALSAGCIYVLSKSLLVSALFNAVYSAGYWTIALTTTSQNAAATATVSTTAWGTAATVTVLLAAIIFKRNGLVGNLKEVTSTDATRR